MHRLMRGHALTIANAIGATIPHVTLYCGEDMSAPGCGCVALTRVNNLSEHFDHEIPD